MYGSPGARKTRTFPPYCGSALDLSGCEIAGLECGGHTIDETADTQFKYLGTWAVYTTEVTAQTAQHVTDINHIVNFFQTAELAPQSVGV
jgi:hypothetical protein